MVSVTGPHARTPRTHEQWVVGPGHTPKRTSAPGWGTPDPGRPTRRQEAPPPRGPSCRPHSSQSQFAKARSVGLVIAHLAGTPGTHSQWVVGPGRTPERTSGRGWESARPRKPQTQARGQWVPSCRPYSAQSQPTRARAVGLVTGPQPRTPCTNSQWVVGPGRTPERRSGRGWESTRPRNLLHPGRRCPSRAPSCRPHSAPSQHPRARGVGLVTGPRARSPRTRSQWVVGSGRKPQRMGGRGWESARLWTPRQEAPLPQAPSCRPHSAQSQVTRARAVGLVTGPHARIPRTHSQWVVGTGRTPESTSGRLWESARPRAPHTQARGALPGRSRATPTARKAKSQEDALWGW